MPLELDQWIAETVNPDLDKLANPRARMEDAIRDMLRVSYARGLRDGLQRLEMLAATIPTRRCNGPWFAAQAQREVDAALAEWRKSVGR